MNDPVGTNKTFLHAPTCPGGQYTIGPLNVDPRCTLEYEGHKL